MRLPAISVYSLSLCHALGSAHSGRGDRRGECRTRCQRVLVRLAARPTLIQIALRLLLHNRYRYQNRDRYRNQINQRYQNPSFNVTCKSGCGRLGVGVEAAWPWAHCPRHDMSKCRCSLSCCDGLSWIASSTDLVAVLVNRFPGCLQCYPRPPQPLSPVWQAHRGTGEEWRLAVAGQPCLRCGERTGGLFRAELRVASIPGEEIGDHPSPKATAWHARTVYD